MTESPEVLTIAPLPVDNWFHVANGLYFARLLDGTVRVWKTNDGREYAVGGDGSSNLLFIQDMKENEWASVVSSMSKLGEDYDRWMACRKFHQTDASGQCELT